MRAVHGQTWRRGALPDCDSRSNYARVPPAEEVINLRRPRLPVRSYGWHLESGGHGRRPYEAGYGYRGGYASAYGGAMGVAAGGPYVPYGYAR